MPVLSNISDLVSVCAAHNLTHVIICPGSRNAALTIYFTSHPQFTCFSVSDERSAAYMALGMAQQLQKAVILICTSGTAALNFAPAVAEAYFMEVPLLILTADRPPEWINQYDGQTIFQQEVYGKHVKRAYQLLAESESDDARWFTKRTTNEAIHLAQTLPHGPVHINVPIREPFYPDPNESISFTESLPKVNRPVLKQDLSEPDWKRLAEKFYMAENVLIAVGQQFDHALGAHIQPLQDTFSVTVVADIISNISSDAIRTQDEFLSRPDTIEQVDLLITCGMSFISKNLKTYFRHNQPQEHWHIQPTTVLYDALQLTTEWIPLEADRFFERFIQELVARQPIQEVEFEEKSAGGWEKIHEHTKNKVQAYLESLDVLVDIGAVYELLKRLPPDAILHLGNSMSVRYANSVSFVMPPTVQVYSNRGTSGIDGSLSTAVGSAVANPTKTHFCILGDVSFQYDKNALWLENLPPNLRILVINNAGGNIFKMIPGPANQTSFKQFFQTTQNLTARHFAEGYGISYFQTNQLSEYKYLLDNWGNGSKTPILIEIFTDIDQNVATYKTLKRL